MLQMVFGNGCQALDVCTTGCHMNLWGNQPCLYPQIVGRIKNGTYMQMVRECVYGLPSGVTPVGQSESRALLPTSTSTVDLISSDRAIGPHLLRV